MQKITKLILLAVFTLSPLGAAETISSKQIMLVMGDIIERMDAIDRSIKDQNSSMRILSDRESNNSRDIETIKSLMHDFNKKSVVTSANVDTNKTRLYTVTSKRKLWVYDSPNKQAKIIDRIVMPSIERNVTLDINGRCKLVNHSKGGYVKCWYLNFKD